MRAALLVALAGCFGVGDTDGTWQPIDEVSGALAPELGPAPAQVALAPDGALRVVTWNAHFGADPAALAGALAQSPITAAADVILLQEIEAYPDEPGTRTQRLADALGMTWLYAPARREGAGTHGLAILSRFPIANARVMRLPHAAAAFNERTRIAIAAEIDVGGRVVTIVDVHLDVRINAIDRIRQLHPAVLDLPDPVIVAGDLNTNPWAWVGSAIPLTGHEAILDQDQAAVLDDYFAAIGFASAIAPDRATFNLPLLGCRLDNVYVRGLEIVAADIATDVAGSDHWPVRADTRADLSAAR